MLALLYHSVVAQWWGGAAEGDDRHCCGIWPQRLGVGHQPVSQQASSNSHLGDAA